MNGRPASSRPSLVTRHFLSMTRRKKIALALLALLLVSQAPFAYRSYRLRQLGAAIDELKARRGAEPPPDGRPVREYVGVFHVHSFLGRHSTGTLEEVVRAAKAGRLDFVVMTEHPQPNLDTAAATLNAVYDGVLFVVCCDLVPARLRRHPAEPSAAGTRQAREVRVEARSNRLPRRGARPRARRLRRRGGLQPLHQREAHQLRVDVLRRPLVLLGASRAALRALLRAAGGEPAPLGRVQRLGRGARLRLRRQRRARQRRLRLPGSERQEASRLQARPVRAQLQPRAHARPPLQRR